MVLNRIAKGSSLASFDRLTAKKPVTTSFELMPSFSSVRRFLPLWRDDRPKIEFWAEEGVVEIRDPRLFRDGREPFCLALVGAMVRLGMARRVEIRRGSASCRIEFEPGRFDHDELARNVARSLKAASLTPPGLPPSSPKDRDLGRWITLTAVASTGGPSIWETLIDVDGQVIHQARIAGQASKISVFSMRPLRKPPRRTRTSPPKARPAISGRTAEPLALALSAAPIFGKPSARSTPSLLTGRTPADSRRMVNLALAGGSLAMAVAGVILPGIPALPFLILTGRYLVKSSPELCLKLESIPGIGAWLQKASEAGSQVIDRRSLLKMFGLTVAAVAAFMVLHPPLPIVILLEFGIMAYCGVRTLRRPSRIALRSNSAAGMPCLA